MAMHEGSRAVAGWWRRARAAAFAATAGVAVLVVAGPAVAAGKRPLRAPLHVDRYGRTIEDICPEQSPGQRRCYAHRVVRKGAPLRRALSGGGIANDPNCQAEGGGGGYGGPPPDSMGPSDIVAAYDIPASASAQGKIVAVIELPSPNAFSDMNTYRQAFGIPALPECPTNAQGVPTPNGTPCFSRVGEDGTVNSLQGVDCPGWAAETGLDVAMVSAACPDCSIVVVEASNSNDLSTVNKTAAMVLSPAAISNSWGGPENGPGQDDESPFANANTLTFVASGDSGYMDEDEGNGTAAGSDFPSSSPYVIAVGGTTLSGGGGQGYQEVVWNDDALLGSGAGAGGSGCSAEFMMPSYQTGSGFEFGSCAMRASVDVSAAAEFNPQDPQGGGIAEYDADDGGWNPLTGTSAACPLVAALMTRIGLAGKDNHELFYKNIGMFHDVTEGTNDNDGLCSDVMCNAGPGWDGPSGLGTPDGAKLMTLATAATPAPAPDAGLADDASGASSGAGSAVGASQNDAGSGAPFGGGGAGDGSGAGGSSGTSDPNSGTPGEQQNGGFPSGNGALPMVAGKGSSSHGSSGCTMGVGTSDASDALLWLGVVIAGFVTRRGRDEEASE